MIGVRAHVCVYVCVRVHAAGCTGLTGLQCFAVSLSLWEKEARMRAKR